MTDFPKIIATLKAGKEVVEAIGVAIGAVIAGLQALAALRGQNAQSQRPASNL